MIEESKYIDILIPRSPILDIRNYYFPKLASWYEKKVF